MEPTTVACIVLGSTVSLSIIAAVKLLDRKKKDVAPMRTVDMRLDGLVWRQIGDEWCKVCDFCGGNCGQCGLTGKIGNIPSSMVRMGRMKQEGDEL